MTALACPSVDELAAWSEGRLPFDRIESIAVHLDDCPSCASALDALDSGLEPWVSDVDGPAPDDPVLDESGCREALARFEAVIAIP